MADNAWRSNRSTPRGDRRRALTLRTAVRIIGDMSGNARRQSAALARAWRAAAATGKDAVIAAPGPIARGDRARRGHRAGSDRNRRPRVSARASGPAAALIRRRLGERKREESGG
ncbi:MAG: hypothetical protein HS111_23740 [Kofleriaceae bacterium]|nr:hypothetical protein [Kofleriaceae bacterium]